MLYGSEEDTLSPRLMAQKPNYEPDISEPPPFESDRSNSRGTRNAAGTGTSPGRCPKDCPEETQDGDSVLIRSMDPNRNDIASFERIYPLSKELPSGDDFHKTVRPLPKPLGHAQVDLSEMSEKATNALYLLKESPAQKAKNESPFARELANKSEPTSPERHRTLSVDTTYGSVQAFPIPASESKLPALQPSPSTLGASPPNTQILPSIQSALGAVFPRRESSGMVNSASPYSFSHVPGASPSVRRSDLAREPQFPGQFPPSQIPPSPYSHLSPASSKDMSNISSPVSQQSFWRLPPKSDMGVPSSYESSPQMMKGPGAGYPTPTDQTSDHRPSFSSSTASSGSASTGIYKCQHPECTAPPFQTQYLLNSHANVHSQDRPHFCPVEGCPRGPGGKGFKRKNEMIRHGLVHNSPGYMCPFCPDQQHRYPRPDNLQR